MSAAPKPLTDGKRSVRSNRTGYIPTRLVAVACTATGHPVGASHPNAKHDDTLPARAREMRAQGLTYRAIGKALGVSEWTARHWAVGDRRNVPAQRTIMRRVPVQQHEEQHLD